MHWLQATQEHLGAPTLSLRLTHLLMQRLKNPLASSLVGLLLSTEHSLFSGMLLELEHGDASNNYPQFLEHAPPLNCLAQPKAAWGRGSRSDNPHTRAFAQNIGRAHGR